MCCSFPLVKMWPFHNKSGFSINENMYWICFKLLKHHAKTSVHRAFGSWAVLSDKVKYMHRWKKSKGRFLKQTATDAVFSSMSRIYFASRKFPASCFVDFARLPSGDCHLPCYVLLAFPWLWKEDIFIHNQASTQRRTRFELVSSHRNLL